MDDALSAVPLLRSRAPATLADVGSGGGSPGIPLAVALPATAVTLIEATSAKAGFLRDTVAALGLAVDVLASRSEDVARGDGRDRFDVVTARALAPPPVAAELCLPLVRPGGVAVLWTAGADAAAVSAVAGQVGGGRVTAHATGGRRELLVIEKSTATPARFPRRPGMAAKRPLRPLASPP